MTRLLFLTLILSLSYAQDTGGTGSISGTVKGAIQATVCIPSIPRCVDADLAGTFRLTGLRAGKYKLEVTVTGAAKFTSPELELSAGLDSIVELTIPALNVVEQTLTITESVVLPAEEIKNSGYLISRYEIFKAAGAQQDVSRYVQTLPGVSIGNNDFRNDLIVRGGSPLENLFIVDNVEIPNINNFANFASAGGTTSLLDPDLIGNVTFLTGAFPAAFSNRTSSVLQIAQREGNRERFASRLSLGSAGLGWIAEGPLRQKRGSWIVSARRSFLDAFTKDIGLGGVPVNYNFNAKALYDLGPRDRIWLVNISGVDKIRLGPTAKKSSDPDRDPELDLIDIRYKGWRAATGLNWQHLFGESGFGLLGLTYSDARVQQNTKDLFKFGLAAATVDDLIARSPLLFRENNREAETTLKYDYTAYLHSLGKLQAGASLKWFRLRYDTAQPFGQDNPYSTFPNQNPFFFNSSLLATQSSVYVQTSRNLGARLNLTSGIRFDRFQALNRSRVSPRMGASYRLSDKLSLRASYGLHFQSPQLLFVKAFPVNQGLIPIRASHLVAGFAYLLNSSTRASLEIYQKSYNSYPVSTQFRSFSLANAGDTFAVTDILLPYTSAGRGRVRGIELSVEKKFTTRWYGQGNVSLSRTRFSALDGIMRPGTYDYPVIFNALGGYNFRKHWDFSARTVFLSGKPYTPFDEKLSREQLRGIFDLSRVNALRAPNYFRLDIRVDRTFTVRGKALLVFGGLQNVTNSRNVSGTAWDRAAGKIRFNRQLGLFPVLGFDWRL